MSSSAITLPEERALWLASVRGAEFEGLAREARAIRDAAFGRTLTFSPKVFLPVTNLCRNHCDYCSFRRSAGDRGEWTMAPSEIESTLTAGAAAGCTEALLCLGDAPDTAFPSYRAQLNAWGHVDTAAYLEWTSERALERGVLPHTNAGVLSRDAMRRLKRTNVSLGLMLENISPRLCERGMPHHRAPDKRPARRVQMMMEAGELQIPFTTGILIGIGETREERALSLLAIAGLHARYGHIQEVIVQNFTPRPDVPMSAAPSAGDEEMAHAVVMARLLLPPDVSVQAPPNLNAERTTLLVDSGINDLGGISPVTRDYINPRHPWPHLGRLADHLRAQGFELAPRLPIYERFVATPGFLNPALNSTVASARARLESSRLTATPERSIVHLEVSP